MLRPPFMSILVTGFQPGRHPLNASCELVKSLGRVLKHKVELPDERVDFALLPNDTWHLPHALLSRLSQGRPDTVLLTGQAPERRRITLERFAINWRDFLVPDGAQNMVRGSRVVPEGPLALQCQGVDLDEIVQKLNQQGTPAEISNYAGNSLCNQALYLTLYYAKVHRMPLRVIFMHLLVLPQQVASGEYPDSAFMPLDTACDAAALVVSELLLDAQTPTIQHKQGGGV